MKLNNITELHTRADIDDKDVVWAFIVEEFRDSMEGCIEYKSDRFAVYSEHGKLVEVIHEGNALRIESADHDAAIEVAHRLIDPVNESDKNNDVYGKIYDPAEDPKFRAMFVSFIHSNTDVLKCRYSFDDDGEHHEGEFFLDMLNPDIYEGVHEGISASNDFPDELIFSKIVEVGHGLHGYEIQARLNAETDKVEVTECTVYEWIEYSDGRRENIDTIDNAEITIINIDTNEVINQ